MLAPIRMVERRREIEAIEVTPDNIHAVAVWCGGTVIADEHGQPVAVGVPIGGSILQAGLGLYVAREFHYRQPPTHRPVPEGALFWSYEPVG